MKSLLFIINPIAGGGRTKRVIPIIEKTMNESNIEYKIQYTKEPKEATRIAEENSKNYSAIIAVGGDGTVNEVAKGLINSGCGILGIIPSGTGNDLSRSLGISQDPNIALEIIINENYKNIDIGRVNGHNFLNIASIGFDTEVVCVTNTIKKRIKNKIAYILGILWTLLYYRKASVDLEIDGISYKRNLVLLAIGKGKYYGGGLKVLPMAEIDNGYLHICLVKDISNLKILFLFPSIIKGNHLKYKKYVEIYKGRHIILKNKDQINLNIDGEIILVNSDIEFEIDKYKLSVLN